jgi:predicted membrane-bound spermidine synthase
VPLALVAFFLSGFAALLYQVLWQRLLVLFAGADVHAVTIIVAVYMVGLGLGSFLGGRLGTRLDGRGSLWAFVAAEVGIAMFALSSKWLFYDVLYVRVRHLGETRVLGAVVLFLSLLWPTLLMGVSLPLLARALTTRVALAGHVIGSLYGWNVLGAATGAFVGTWLLLPRFGLERSLSIAAAVSLTCAALAVTLAFQPTSAPTTAGAGRPEPDGNANGWPLSFRGWALAFGLSGFVALGFEIAVFRVLSVLMKSTAFTFGTLVGIYLAGLGVGATVAARRVLRSARPGVAFLLLQCGVAVYVLLSSLLLVNVLDSGHPVKLVRYLAGYEPVDIAATVALFDRLGEPGAITRLTDFVVLYFGVPFLLIAPATVLMGASFPYLQKASHQTLEDVGWRLGVLLAVNIAGSALGAMATGWLLLPFLGTAATLQVLVALGTLFAWPLARPAVSATRRRAAAAVGVMISAGVIALMPGGQRLWATLHGTTPDRILFAEDAAGLSVLKTDDANSGDVGVFVNGLGQSWIPYGAVHTVLGALPTLTHPAPRSVLIIGLGSGDTAFAAASRAEVQRVVTVEIIASQRRTLHQLARRFPYPGLRAVLTDPRFDHRVGDGRAFLEQTTHRFDVIQADALRPGSAYAGTLYSREYFDLVRRRLSANGLAVTWVPTDRVARTFASVFPYVLGIQDIYVGSNAPIPFQREVVRARAATAAAYFAEAGVELEPLLLPYLEFAPVVLGPESERSLIDLNTDMFPRDEFALPF